MSQTAFQLSPVSFLLVVSLFIDGQVPEHSNKNLFVLVTTSLYLNFIHAS